MKKVSIPEKMQKFYGVGIMLHPDIEMVEELVKLIPHGKVATIDTICQKLAGDYGAKVTCPMRTASAIKSIAELTSLNDVSVPFWRIIRKNHLLINSSQIERCVDNLVQEGFKLSQTAKGDFKLMDINEKLFAFD